MTLNCLYAIYYGALWRRLEACICIKKMSNEANLRVHVLINIT